MSHRSTVETKIASLDMLKKAIKALNLSYYEGQDLVGRYTSGWNADAKKADLVLDIENRRDIGFRKNSNGFYDLVGDFYALSMSQKQLGDMISQMYNVEYVKDVIENSSEHGISSYTTTVLPNGDIVLEGEIDEQLVNA